MLGNEPSQSPRAWAGRTVASIDSFCADGFLALRGAVATDVVRACVEVIENELRTRGVEPSDARTWSGPVVRLPCPETSAFTAAGTSPPLRDMYDALLGAGRWIEREGVGGTVPVRFPSKRDPGDAGWHIDGSYDVQGQWWVNVHSRYRGLLALFLFTDVTDRDAPTELIVGSHLDVPRVLAPYGRPVRPPRRRRCLRSRTGDPAWPWRARERMRPRQLVQAWVDAFNRTDADALAAFYTEDEPRLQSWR